MLSMKTGEKIAQKYGVDMADRVEKLPKNCHFPRENLADFIAEWEAVTAKLRGVKE